MGFLTITGKLVRWEEFKDHVEDYKRIGLKQFVRNWNKHKDRFIERADLHWGEEQEYACFDLLTSETKP
jgi:hypothetical protein